MTVIEQRTGFGTRRDAREHWKEQGGFALLAMLTTLLIMLILAVPAWFLDSRTLEIFIQALGFSLVWTSVRLAYTIYKYVRI